MTQRYHDFAATSFFLLQDEADEENQTYIAKEN